MKIGDEITGPVRQAWHRFIESTGPVRPDLYRYCRSLTGSVWDGEDLVQDTLLRAFARLSEISQPIENVRAYLLRIASNLWIDRFRATREFASADLPDQPAVEAPESHVIRDAARQLFHHLPPMERATILLKDVFDFTLEETATALETTTGGVKAALHRGRTKLLQLQQESPSPQPAKSNPTAELVDKFVDAFNARDLQRLTAMMRHDAISEMVGMVVEEGAEAIEKNERGVLRHTFAAHPTVDDWWAEARLYDGTPVILFWARESGLTFVSSMLRLEEREGAIARLRYYFFCPEAMAEVCGNLAVAVKTNGYRPTWN